MYLRGDGWLKSLAEHYDTRQHSAPGISIALTLSVIAHFHS